MFVHSEIGCGFQEIIYQRALVIEFKYKGLSFERERDMDIFYCNLKVGKRRVDFFIEEKIMLEIKAVKKLEDVHLAQALNYLETYNLETGLLINFGAKSLEFKRLFNKNHIKKIL